MGALDLLQHLRGAGFVLALTQDGGLKVTPAGALTDEHRRDIRAQRDGLVAALLGNVGVTEIPGNFRIAVPSASGPVMSGPKGDPLDRLILAQRNFASSWSDAEIEVFTARHARLERAGYSATDAEDLAERLMLRDHDGDDRRMCVECTHLGERGRCLAATAGRLLGADRRLQPVRTVLQRCEGFGLRKGLT